MRRATRDCCRETCSARGRSGRDASSSTATDAGCRRGASSSSRWTASASFAIASLDSDPRGGCTLSAVMENPMSVGEVPLAPRLLPKALRPFIVDTFRELGRADAREPGFVLYHGPVNNDEDGPVEVCVPVADGDKRLPAGEIAFTEITGEQCRFPQILGAYDAVYRWVKAND